MLRGGSSQRGIVQYADVGAPSTAAGNSTDFYLRKDAAGLLYLKDSLGLNWSLDTVPPEIVLAQAYEGQAGLDEFTGTGSLTAGRAVFMYQLPADLTVPGSHVEFKFSAKGSGSGTGVDVTAGIATYDNQVLTAGAKRKDVFGKAALSTSGRFDVTMTLKASELGFGYEYSYVNGGASAGTPAAGDFSLSAGLASSFVFLMFTENTTSGSNGATATLLGVRLALRPSLAAKFTG